MQKLPQGEVRFCSVASDGVWVGMSDGTVLKYGVGASPQVVDTLETQAISYFPPSPAMVRSPMSLLVWDLCGELHWFSVPTLFHLAHMRACAGGRVFKKGSRSSKKALVRVCSSGPTCGISLQLQGSVSGKSSLSCRPQYPHEKVPFVEVCRVAGKVVQSSDHFRGDPLQLLSSVFLQMRSLLWGPFRLRSALGPPRWLLCGCLPREPCLAPFHVASWSLRFVMCSGSCPYVLGSVVSVLHLSTWLLGPCTRPRGICQETLHTSHDV